ncbi:MAG: hypothetical protein IJT94_04905 [Oscillibacter sp.]|nr:hypothetical protein [Oscillibacter sp.]
MSTPYLMTHSLLYSWQYALRENPYADATTEDTSMSDFLRTLRREPTPTTEAMQNGIDFEDLVTRVVSGRADARDQSSPWFDAAGRVAFQIRGAFLQYKAKKMISVNGTDFLLYGRLDALKAGTVFDIKFSGKYERGKFYDSTQHPVYLELLPEAYRFVYLISDGRNVWTEEYHREDTRSVIPIIQDFMAWLSTQNLMETYKKHWTSLPNN